MAGKLISTQHQINKLLIFILFERIYKYIRFASGFVAIYAIVLANNSAYKKVFFLSNARSSFTAVFGAGIRKARAGMVEEYVFLLLHFVSRDPFAIYLFLFDSIAHRMCALASSNRPSEWCASCDVNKAMKRYFYGVNAHFYRPRSSLP